MRTLLIGALGMVLAIGSAAEAQRTVVRGRGTSGSVARSGDMVERRGALGSDVRRHAERRGVGVDRARGHPGWRKRDGRWIGGWNAPGGWNAYRPPQVGWPLPPYWTQPWFGIVDWAGYGLAPPPHGYAWSRYYDDAVLIDDRGSVYGTVADVDWDGYAARGDDEPGDDERAPPGRRSVSNGSTATVTAAGGYGSAGGTTVTTVSSGSVVTSTAVAGGRANGARQAGSRTVKPR